MHRPPPRRVGQMQKNPAVTDTQRSAMKVTVPKTTHTPAGVPTSRPVAKIDTAERLRHTINFTDEATPTSRAKPAGVAVCEVCFSIGTTAPPTRTPCTCKPWTAPRPT